MFVEVTEVAGTKTSGSGADAIVQSVTAGSLNGTGTSLTVTLSALATAANAVWSTFVHETNEGHTPGGGATELAETGAGGSRISANYEVGDNSHSVSWASSSYRGAVAVEIANANYLTLAGAVTPTGFLANRALKAFAGSITPTGALTYIKAQVMYVAGSITPSGALVNATLKTLAGSVTPTGTLSKVVSKSFGGAITPVGALTKVFGKVLGGSITPVGNFLRTVSLALSGQITPSGSLATTFRHRLLYQWDQLTAALTTVTEGILNLTAKSDDTLTAQTPASEDSRTLTPKTDDTLNLSEADEDLG